MKLSIYDGSLENRSGIGRDNSLVLKPSETTPLSTLRLAELAAPLLPQGTFNVALGKALSGSQWYLIHKRPWSR